MNGSRASFVFPTLAVAALLGQATASRASTKDYMGFLMSFSDTYGHLAQSKNVYCTFPARNGRKETIKTPKAFTVCLDGEVVDASVGLKVGRRYFVGDKGKILLASSRHDGMIEGYIKRIDAGKRSLTIQGFDGRNIGASAIEAPLADDAVITLNNKPAQLADLPLDSDIYLLPAGPQRVEIYTRPHATYEPTGREAAGFEGVAVSAGDDGSFVVYNRRTGEQQRIKENRRAYFKLDGDASGMKAVVVPGRRIVCLASRNNPSPTLFFSISTDASLVSGTVKAVNGTELEVEVPGPEGPVMRKLNILPGAEITLDGKPADAQAVNIGRWVRVLAPRKQEVIARSIPYAGNTEAIAAVFGEADKYKWVRAATALTRWTCHDPETRLPVMCEMAKNLAAREGDKRGVFDALSQGLLDVPETVRRKHADMVIDTVVAMMPDVGFHLTFCIDLMAAHPAPVAKHRETIEAAFRKNGHRVRSWKAYWDKQVVPKLETE